MLSRPIVLRYIASWLLPSAVELCAYIFVALLTLLLSNFETAQKFLMVSDSFDIKVAVLGSIESLLASLLGESAVAALITAVFWGLAGMLVYIVLWLFANFSTEFTNDLLISRYVHPKGANTMSPLMHFAMRLLFQLLAAILLLFYLNFLLQGMLPLVSASFTRGIDEWPALGSVYGIALAAAGEVAALHIATILVRLTTMRKRVFGK